MNKKIAIYISIGVIVLIAAIIGILFIINNEQEADPVEVINTYISYLNEKKYYYIYDIMTENSKSNISQEDLVTRVKNIYEGIEMQDMKINVTNIDNKSKGNVIISYDCIMNTMAGEVKTPIKAELIMDEEKNYKLEWYSGLIFLDLTRADKVRVATYPSQRGGIIDRNDKILAGNRDTTRAYPLGEATSHLIGYVGSITEEELDKRKGARL